jgi:hypothetical protein
MLRESGACRSRAFDPEPTSCVNPSDQSAIGDSPCGSLPSAIGPLQILPVQTEDAFRWVPALANAQPKSV